MDNPVCGGGRHNGSNGSGVGITLADLTAVRDGLGSDVGIERDGEGWRVGGTYCPTGEEACEAIRGW